MEKERLRDGTPVSETVLAVGKQEKHCWLHALLVGFPGRVVGHCGSQEAHLWAVRHLFWATRVKYCCLNRGLPLSDSEWHTEVGGGWGGSRGRLCKLFVEHIIRSIKCSHKTDCSDGASGFLSGKEDGGFHCKSCTTTTFPKLLSSSRKETQMYIQWGEKSLGYCATMRLNKDMQNISTGFFGGGGGAMMMLTFMTRTRFTQCRISGWGGGMWPFWFSLLKPHVGVDYKRQSFFKKKLQNSTSSKVYLPGPVIILREPFILRVNHYRITVCCKEFQRNILVSRLLAEPS